MEKRVYDLVFEGGGAKGAVFAGALQELLRDGSRIPGRLLGTSAGAITSMLLAAGYTPDEILSVLAEKDAQGRSVFNSFMESPGLFDDLSIERSSLRQVLRDLDLSFVPDFLEERIDGWLARGLVSSELGRHIFSFIERGGCYSADRFLEWLCKKLDTGQFNGAPRRFSGMTLLEFREATGTDMTVVAADTSGSQILFLNHRTAPQCPVVWAVRMSMSIPFVWQEVEWRAEWGPYHTWNSEQESLVPTTISGHAIVDGGILSNFPIALFLSNRPDVEAIVGASDPSGQTSVLGMLIDETLPVENRPIKPSNPGKQSQFDLRKLKAWERIQRLISTTTDAHDNMAIAIFARFIARLPAAGYETTQFDMTDAERLALVDAGRKAIESYLHTLHRGIRIPGPTGTRGMAVEGPEIEAIQSLANLAAGAILR